MEITKASNIPPVTIADIIDENSFDISLVLKEYDSYEMNELPKPHSEWLEGCYESGETIVYICKATGWYFTYDKRYDEYHTIIYAHEYFSNDLNKMIEIVRSNFDG